MGRCIGTALKKMRCMFGLLRHPHNEKTVAMQFGSHRCGVHASIKQLQKISSAQVKKKRRKGRTANSMHFKSYLRKRNKR